ncbi:MAG TPA: DUF4369 domain-containing protein [Flavobacteriia bacterium]|nr:DUF4369 domain-containing protein [Flavobacteriia bacterium]
MKNFLLYILTSFLFFSCQENLKDAKANRFVISGTIQGIEDATKVYLETRESGVLLILDSTTIRNGKFRFEGTIDKPSVYGILIEDVKGTIGILMENKNISIEAYKDSLSSSKIVGSNTNDEYLNFVHQSNQIVSKMNVLFPVFQKARSENDVKVLDSINKKMQAINNQNTAFALHYARQHPNSYVGAIALHSVIRVPTISKDTILKIYSHFSDSIKRGDFAIETLHFIQTSTKRDSILH